MNDFNYNTEEKENIACNLCGGSDFTVLARRSKNNLEARTVICKRCALIFISPRMKKEGFNRYYKYFYRTDRGEIKGHEPDLEQNFTAAEKFGGAWAKKYRQYLKEGLTVDVGSSTGGLLYGLKEEIPSLKVLGIEPSIDESEYAKRKGIPTFALLFEDFHDEVREKAANVFCVQSLNHLLDPMKFLRWSHEVLEEGGYIHLAVKNWRHQVRRAGNIKAGVQIDHPYMFLPETLKRMVEAAGFEVVDFDVDEKKSMKEISEQKQIGFNIHHVRLVARKTIRHANVGHSVSNIIDRGLCLRTRFSLSKISLKFYYLFWYSRPFAPIRKVLFLEGRRH